MASNFKHSGRVNRITDASAGVTSGNLVFQEGILGVALTTALSGAAFDVAITGVWNLTVPGGVAAGELLYADLNAGESVDVTLTETSTTNTFVGRAETARVGTTANVNLLGHGVLDVFNDTA